MPPTRNTPISPRCGDLAGGRKKSTPATNKPKPPSEPATPSSLPAEETPGAEEAKVPTVRVNLVQSVQLLPHQSLVIEVTCSFAGDGENDDSAAYLLEPTELKSGLQVEPLCSVCQLRMESSP